MSILRQREKTHGLFSDVAAVSQKLKDALRLGPYDELPDSHREALEMICVKMARVVCGDHNEPDHFVDIRGYAELVLNHITTVPSGSSPQEEPPDDPPEPDVGNCFNTHYRPRFGQPR